MLYIDIKKLHNLILFFLLISSAMLADVNLQYLHDGIVVDLDLLTV